MAISRYDNTKTIVKTSAEVKKNITNFVDNSKYIKYYSTSKVPTLTLSQIETLIFNEHIWSYGDRMWRLAQEYYGDFRYWWVIAWFNNCPTDLHCQEGQTIYIPMPLEKMLMYYGV